ncbi:MAG: alpha/beta hydrolase fold domain-containing protein [Chthoniobacterales bacterium]|nr:alpha/beta hydrolase fold domain-containing protein [Chthoniobacterales bacterium]
MIFPSRPSLPNQFTVSKNSLTKINYEYPEKNTLKNLLALTATALFCFLFVFFAMRMTPIAKATPTPTPTATPFVYPSCTITPTIPPTNCQPDVDQNCASSPCSAPTYPPSPSPAATPIPSLYQPGDGTVLEWRVFPATSPSPYPSIAPSIVFLHEGGFYTGNVFSRSNEPVYNDMASRGYNVYVCAYRLAPCGLVKGQACHDDTVAGLASGRPPQQTNDIKAFIKAARADGRSNGKLAVIGGSAGGSHAAFVALDTASSVGWPNWTATDRADVTACLSGAYNFSDQTAESYGPDPLPDFQFYVENYTNSCDPDVLRSLSPVAKVGSSTASNFKPMYIINSEKDPMPFHQIVDLKCALEGAGVDTSKYKVVTIPHSHEHAFDFWFTIDAADPTKTWGDHIMDFVGAHLP